MNADALALLAAKGFTIAEAVDLLRALETSQQRKQTGAARRQKAYRERVKASREDNEIHNERDVTRDVTRSPIEKDHTQSVVTEANASSTTDRRVKARRLPENWEPTLPLPPKVQKLVDAWPQGRMERELDGFRDFWTTASKNAARPDWDRTWWNRIRDQHDRIIRENSYAQRSQPAASPSLALLRHSENEAEREDAEFDRTPRLALRAVG